MPCRIWMCLALLCATAAATTAQGLRLQLDYSEELAAGIYAVPESPVATDGAGSIYILATGAVSSVTKLAPVGNQIIYQTTIPFQATDMAVDAAGDVYLSGFTGSTLVVEKLGVNGSTVDYAMSLPNVGSSLIAVDAEGRAYIAGQASPGAIPTTPQAFQTAAPASPNIPYIFIMRLTVAGGIDYATYLAGKTYSAIAADVLSGLAVDSTGSAFVTGMASAPDFPTTVGAYLTARTAGQNATFVTRLCPDGSSLIYSTFTNGDGAVPQAFVVDPSDNAELSFPTGIGTYVLTRLNPQGSAVTFSLALPILGPVGMAVDAAGNTYIAGTVNAMAYAPKNSLAPCIPQPTLGLTVIDPNGVILQSTYVPGAGESMLSGIAMTPDSQVLLVGSLGLDFAPTRAIPGWNGPAVLMELSPNPTVATVQLACISNAATFDTSVIAPGEIVSLYGEGLGPAAGVLPEVTTASGFPKELADVQVTFNGTPGPLLYVQNNQINAIVPWSVINSVQICVIFNGAPTNCMTRGAQETDPGVFTVDGIHAAALNQDGSTNSASNPAKVGSVVSVFATGLGPLSPPPSDGSIIGFPLPLNVAPAPIYWEAPSFSSWPVLPPPPQYFSVVETYDGPAPFEVAGVSQINFIVQDTDGQAFCLDYNVCFQIYTAP